MIPLQPHLTHVPLDSSENQFLSIARKELQQAIQEDNFQKVVHLSREIQEKKLDIIDQQLLLDSMKSKQLLFSHVLDSVRNQPIDYKKLLKGSINEKNYYAFSLLLQRHGENLVDQELISLAKKKKEEQSIPYFLEHLYTYRLADRVNHKEITTISKEQLQQGIKTGNPRIVALFLKHATKNALDDEIVQQAIETSPEKIVRLVLACNKRNCIDQKVFTAAQKIDTSS